MNESHSRSLSRRALADVLLHIERRITAPIKLVELASIARLSPSHFSRQFRGSVGETPFCYVRRARIERAKRLLERGELPFSEIALEAGFCDQSHFCRVFRAVTGMTPREFVQRRSVSEQAIALLPVHAQALLSCSL